MKVIIFKGPDNDAYFSEILKFQNSKNGVEYLVNYQLKRIWVKKEDYILYEIEGELHDEEYFKIYKDLAKEKWPEAFI